VATRSSLGYLGPYRAPLILVPVQLERKSVRSGFRLALHEDEARFNPTLMQMLKQDFDLSMPEFDGELPQDASGGYRLTIGEDDVLLYGGDDEQILVVAPIGKMPVARATAPTTPTASRDALGASTAGARAPIR